MTKEEAILYEISKKETCFGESAKLCLKVAGSHFQFFNEAWQQINDDRKVAESAMGKEAVAMLEEYMNSKKLNQMK